MRASPPASHDYNRLQVGERPDHSAKCFSYKRFIMFVRYKSLTGSPDTTKIGLLKKFINKVDMNWQDVLSKNGYRVSGPRRLVMQLLESNAQPMTPLEIYQELSESGRDLGMASVYRALELLTELELICVVYDHDGSAGYVAGGVGHHHHILCQKCHQAVAFAGSEDLSSLIQRVEEETNYRVSDHLLQLYGICPDCQKKMAKKGEEN